MCVGRSCFNPSPLERRNREYPNIVSNFWINTGIGTVVASVDEDLVRQSVLCRYDGRTEAGQLSRLLARFERTLSIPGLSINIRNRKLGHEGPIFCYPRRF